MKPRHVFIAIALAALVLGARFFLAGDETQVERALEAVAAAATKTGAETQIVAFGKAREIAKHFTEDAEAAETDGAVGQGRDAITRAIAWARSRHEAALVSVSNVQVTLTGPDTADATCIVSVEGPDGPIDEFDGMKASLQWRKVSGDWLIASVFVDRP